MNRSAQWLLWASVAGAALLAAYIWGQRPGSDDTAHPRWPSHELAFRPPWRGAVCLGFDTSLWKYTWADPGDIHPSAPDPKVGERHPELVGAHKSSRQEDCILVLNADSSYVLLLPKAAYCGWWSVPTSGVLRLDPFPLTGRERPRQFRIVGGRLTQDVTVPWVPVDAPY